MVSLHQLYRAMGGVHGSRSGKAAEDRVVGEVLMGCMQVSFMLSISEFCAIVCCSSSGSLLCQGSCPEKVNPFSLPILLPLIQGGFPAICMGLDRP